MKVMVTRTALVTSTGANPCSSFKSEKDESPNGGREKKKEPLISRGVEGRLGR